MYLAGIFPQVFQYLSRSQYVLACTSSICSWGVQTYVFPFFADSLALIAELCQFCCRSYLIEHFAVWFPIQVPEKIFHEGSNLRWFLSGCPRWMMDSMIRSKGCTFVSIIILDSAGISVPVMDAYFWISEARQNAASVTERREKKKKKKLRATSLRFLYLESQTARWLWWGHGKA